MTCDTCPIDWVPKAYTGRTPDTTTEDTTA